MNRDTKILVCDDSILARKSLCSILENFGYTDVAEVSNGEDCVNYCRDNRPGIVLLDIVMPVKDGVTATREIMEINPDTKIVIVSSVGTQTHIKEAIKAGAKDFVQKPIDEELLKQILENIDG
ncbi:MAG: response regulator [Lachnospiraceae bacterium]|nr:response regulator [Lachnospiraceae bacterium]MBR4574638.1 response regulator [Lachnospiraceae bacterium]